MKDRKDYGPADHLAEAFGCGALIGTVIFIILWIWSWFNNHPNFP